MKTPNKRLEELENGQSQKPILILWGDWKNPDVCRVADNSETLGWEEAEKRYAEKNILIRVKYVDNWRANDD